MLDIIARPDGDPVSQVVIQLPQVVRAMYATCLAVRDHYAHTKLAFTPDGKLVGDIGEALAVEAFGIDLCRKRTPGVDGYAPQPDGRCVQIKATGKAGKGPSFSRGEGVAKHLIFFRINFEAGDATVLYNGPEGPVRNLLRADGLYTTTTPSLSEVLKLDMALTPAERLPLVAR